MVISFCLCSFLFNLSLARIDFRQVKTFTCNYGRLKLFITFMSNSTRLWSTLRMHVGVGNVIEVQH